MKKGFTLIELLVVVLIIGILAAVAVPQYEKAVERARAAEAVVDMGVLSQAVDRFVLANGLSGTNGDISDSLDITLPNTTKFNLSTNCYSGAGCNVNIEQVADNYRLFGFRDTDGVWSKECIYKTPIGQNVCIGLVPNGYTATSDDDIVYAR